MSPTVSSFRYKETVEICGNSMEKGSYYVATVLAAIGKTRFLVQYQTRSAASGDNAKPLTAIVDAAEVRPLPPEIPVGTLDVSGRVDAYLSGAWRVGTVARRVDPNYIVRLDGSGDEIHCPFYRIRVHLDWVEGKWIYRKNGVCNSDAKGTTAAGGEIAPS